MTSAIHFWFGRWAANCRSRMFDGTLAVWRSPSSFGRRRRRGPQSLQAHQPFDPMQTTFDAICKQVSPDPPCTIGPIAGKEACLVFVDLVKAVAWPAAVFALG
jgi:hypothetical protein